MQRILGYYEKHNFVNYIKLTYKIIFVTVIHYVVQLCHPTKNKTRFFFLRIF